ncbi:hypothetical protein N7468_006719 [Penicillium chermesinum]|uniref:Uncharacterized protein n=1 Tax=Penicillium chermesinum TaxID=63820 RepID=A0A9W9NSW5_9EURO|nr:uncharacterized protein N7468_006719 [Penicillium chermesinum]KAJ5225494.1 hypothetical protein N7468_006719 [Penicillium chermesinum]
MGELPGLTYPVIVGHAIPVRSCFLICRTSSGTPSINSETENWDGVVWPRGPRRLDARIDGDSGNHHFGCSGLISTTPPQTRKSKATGANSPTGSHQGASPIGLRPNGRPRRNWPVRVPRSSRLRHFVASIAKPESGDRQDGSLWVCPLFPTAPTFIQSTPTKPHGPLWPLR